jgi:hypothetical protein
VDVIRHISGLGIVAIYEIMRGSFSVVTTGIAVVSAFWLNVPCVPWTLGIICWMGIGRRENLVLMIITNVMLVA